MHGATTKIVGPIDIQKLMEKGPKNMQTYTTHASIPPSWQLDLYV
jgi:hypothetical protein